MINEKLLQTHNDFNHFTYSLMNRIINTGKPVKVKLRDGSYREVLFVDIDTDEGPFEPYFYAEDYEYVWNVDGSSCKNCELDMIEIED